MAGSRAICPTERPALSMPRGSGAMTDDRISGLIDQALQAVGRVDFDRAEALCNEALRLEPEAGPALHLMGIMSHHRGGDPEITLAWLEPATLAGRENAQN